MNVAKSKVEYRIDAKQLDIYRETLDELDGHLCCAKRAFEKLNDIRDKIRNQCVTVSGE